MNIEYKKYFYILTALILIADLAILLNIPFLRQIFGFLFLTILPGLLILQILKLDKIGFTEKFVLSVGLSISFLMFFELLINTLSLSLWYETPLATIPLLISFNIAAFALILVAYRMNNDAVFSLPDSNLTSSEKAFLIVPILFPALNIFGMHIMNTTDNNIVLMFLLLLIPIYVAFVFLKNQKFPERIYPLVIFLISISLLVMLALRSNHIIGLDAHQEYYFFQTTLYNLHWGILEHSALDACLAISLLPTIYQSILNVNSEFLFKILYSLLFSISPLIIYVISKRYVGEVYAFLASCFFMFQHNFLMTELHARTNTAILFFAFAMMVLFSDKIDPLKKRILFIVFMASCMVSHYSTTYIFFFVMAGTFIGIEALSKKYTFKKVISLTMVILFFSMIFFWYSQVTETAFNAGVGFVEETLSNLNKFFVEETRSTNVQAMLGKDIMQKGIPHKIEFVFSWLTFAFTGIGVITLLRRYKEMSFSELKLKKPDFLKDKFEVTYLVIALVLSGLLVATVALPYITVGYSLERQYIFAMVVLSVFFVVGGITLSKHFFFLKKRKPVLKEKQKSSAKNTSEGRAYLIILLVLIPYFLCVTGVMYNIFGVPRSIILNSEGEQYDLYYVHDQESYGAKWLGDYAERENLRIYTDFAGANAVISHSGISYSLINRYTLLEKDIEIKGYIYLRYYNVVDNKLLGREGEKRDITEYSDKFAGKSKLYNNGGAEIWK